MAISFGYSDNIFNLLGVNPNFMQPLPSTSTTAIPETVMPLITPEDKRNALTMALLQAGFGALAANKPSPYPVSTANVIGEAGLKGLAGYGSALEDTMRRRQAEWNLGRMNELLGLEKQKAASQEQLNKSHANLYDWTMQKDKAEIERREKAAKDVEFALSNADKYQDISGNIYSKPEVENIMQQIISSQTPTVEDVAWRAGQNLPAGYTQAGLQKVKEFTDTLKPVDVQTPLIRAMLASDNGGISKLFEKNGMGNTPVPDSIKTMFGLPQNELVTWKQFIDMKELLKKKEQASHIVTDDYGNVYEIKEGKGQKVEGAKGKTKEAKSEKPEYKEGKALKEIATLQGMKVRLQKGSPLDSAVLAVNPELAPYIGSTDPTVLKSATDAIDRYISYLNQFVSPTRRIAGDMTNNVPKNNTSGYESFRKVVPSASSGIPVPDGKGGYIWTKR